MVCCADGKGGRFAARRCAARPALRAWPCGAAAPRPGPVPGPLGAVPAPFPWPWPLRGRLRCARGPPGPFLASVLGLRPCGRNAARPSLGRGCPPAALAAARGRFAAAGAVRSALSACCGPPCGGGRPLPAARPSWPRLSRPCGASPPRPGCAGFPLSSGPPGAAGRPWRAAVRLRRRPGGVTAAAAAGAPLGSAAGRAETWTAARPPSARPGARLRPWQPSRCGGCARLSGGLMYIRKPENSA